MQPEEERQKYQQTFRELLEKHNISQKEAAELITQKAHQEVTVRRVRSWLARADAKSARSLPLWAIIDLKEALEKKG